MVYQIKVHGHLSPAWSNWFAGMAITMLEDGDTLLTGPVADQAALFGLLRKVRDLGLPLLSVNRIEGDTSADPGTGGTDAAAIKKQEKGATK